MNPTTDREALLQSALDGGGEMSDRELASFARALIADDAFAEDYLASRAMLRDLAELNDSAPAPDIAGRVMARLPEAGSPAAAPSLAGWLVAAIAALVFAGLSGYFFAAELSDAVSAGFDSLLDFPARLLDGSEWFPAAASATIAQSEIWTAASALLALAVFTHGWVLSDRASRNLRPGSGTDSRKEL